MAFAVTNSKTSDGGGGLKISRGLWTADRGDAAGTITVVGHVWGAIVTCQDAGARATGDIVAYSTSYSTTTGRTTITIYTEGIPSTIGGYIIFHGN